MSSDTVFAMLLPVNIQAKLAFNIAVNEGLAQNLSATAHGRYMCVQGQKSYDRDVSRFLRRSVVQDDDPEEVQSGTSTELDSEREDDKDRYGMIYTGHYTLDLSIPPNEPDNGWIAGRSSAGVDVEFSIEFNPNPVIRARHALFNIHVETDQLCILSRVSNSGPSQVSVNGHSISRGTKYALNQALMRIRLGPLEYLFDYTEFGRTIKFSEHLNKYTKKNLGIVSPNFSLTPTPSGRPWIFGDWTIKKSLWRSKTEENGTEKIQTLRKLTELAKTEDDEDRLLHLQDVVYHSGTKDFTASAWDDVALVSSQRSMRPLTR
ncbi:hypothetical protein MMC25_007552 [Agyrium rufum]|nr:hypothetical protein [Agyrium rufum]